MQQALSLVTLRSRLEEAHERAQSALESSDSEVARATTLAVHALNLAMDSVESGRSDWFSIYENEETELRHLARRAALLFKLLVARLDALGQRDALEKKLQRDSVPCPPN